MQVRAAVLQELGRPEAGEFPEPTNGNGHAVVDVLAAGINHLDLLKASGEFYTGEPELPSVVGSDGVGRLPDGRRVYFDETVAPHGAMAEQTLVDPDATIDVPDDLDDATAAAIGNAGIAAMLAFRWAEQLRETDRVLILGATGTVGQLGVQIAKRLGAARVVAAGRNVERLRRMRELGADAIVLIDDLDSEGPYDFILDLLWGEPARAALEAAAPDARHVDLGHLAGTELLLPATLLRPKRLRITGFALFQAPLELRAELYRQVATWVASGEVVVDLERVPIDEIEDAWRRQAAGAHRKLVVVP